MLKGGYDIVSMLEARGLSRSDAIYINTVIKKEEVPYLINSLLSENMESEEELRSILYEYDIDFEEDTGSCELLNDTNPLYTQYGFNVKTLYSNELNDYMLSKGMHFIIKGDSIYFACPDDITLFAINKFIENKDNKMSKYTKISESVVNGKVIGFGNNIERRRLAKLAGLKEDFGDFDLSDDGSVDVVDQELESPDLIPSGDMVDQNIPTDNIVDTTVVPVTNSDALNVILDAFNTIQTALPDLRLSEFKTVVIRADEFTNQIKSAGGSYLSERKLKI